MICLLVFLSDDGFAIHEEELTGTSVKVSSPCFNVKKDLEFGVVTKAHGTY